jgi:hypothetical protein
VRKIALDVIVDSEELPGVPIPYLQSFEFFLDSDFSYESLLQEIEQDLQKGSQLFQGIAFLILMSQGFLEKALEEDRILQWDSVRNVKITQDIVSFTVRYEKVHGVDMERIAGIVKGIDQITRFEDVELGSANRIIDLIDRHETLAADHEEEIVVVESSFLDTPIGFTFVFAPYVDIVVCA